MALVTVANLWERESKKQGGGKFLGGKIARNVKVTVELEDGSTIEVTDVMVFKNRRKQQDTHPDFNIVANVGD